MSNDLFIWTAYDHPSDFPDYYVARKFSVNNNGPTDEFCLANTFDELYERVQERSPYYLDFICRSPEDNPVIMGTWI